MTIEVVFQQPLTPEPRFYSPFLHRGGQLAFTDAAVLSIETGSAYSDIFSLEDYRGRFDMERFLVVWTDLHSNSPLARGSH
jgi:hypothetical protein